MCADTTKIIYADVKLSPAFEKLEVQDLLEKSASLKRSESRCFQLGIRHSPEPRTAEDGGLSFLLHELSPGIRTSGAPQTRTLFCCITSARIQSHQSNSAPPLKTRICIKNVLRSHKHVLECARADR